MNSPLFCVVSPVLCCCLTCSAYKGKPGQGLEEFGPIFHRAATSLCADSATFAIASTSAPSEAQSPEALPSQSSLTRQERHPNSVHPQGQDPWPGRRSDKGQEGQWPCFHPRQLLGGKEPGGTWGTSQTPSYDGWLIQRGWTAIYCWHRAAINHHLSGAMRKLQGWLSHPPSWRHSRSRATYIPWLWAVPVAQK